MPSEDDKMLISISEKTEKIGKYFKHFQNEMKYKIVNEQEKNNLYYELKTNVRKCLEEVFGSENDIKSNALSKVFLKYNSVRNLNSDAVIFNYWSHEGEPIETPIKSGTGRWRDNLYYKGKRWSDKEKKKLFYEFFDEIKNALQGEAPVDFFTKHGVECNTCHLKIIGLRIQNIAQIKKYSQYQRITIPVLSNTSKVVKSQAFRDLLKFISMMKKVNSDTAQLENFHSIHREKIKNLKAAVLKAYAEAKKEDFDLLNTVKEGFIEGLSTDQKKKNELKKILNLRDAFNVVIAYQYYDHPYDIHMFLPASNHDKLYSCLVITVEKGSEKINPYLESFTALANKLGQIKAIDQEIWKQMKENLPIYWKWKENYEKFSDQHRRISNVAMNICLAICRKEELEVFSIPVRLKEFDSFYNKIVSRANDRDKDYPIKDKSVDKQRWTTRRSKKLKEYRKTILDPTIENAEVILEELKDVVGLRIICLFDTEKDKIIKTFEKLKNDKEIENYELKHFDNVVGYRSAHISFSLGSKRCELYELKDLRDRKCEIQIRTILEQGWADVSHKVVYKSGVPQLLVEKIKEEIEKELGPEAAVLRGVDRSFERIFNKWKQSASR